MSLGKFTPGQEAGGGSALVTGESMMGSLVTTESGSQLTEATARSTVPSAAALGHCVQGQFRRRHAVITPCSDFVCLGGLSSEDRPSLTLLSL